MTAFTPGQLDRQGNGEDRRVRRGLIVFEPMLTAAGQTAKRGSVTSLCQTCGRRVGTGSGASVRNHETRRAGEAARRSRGTVKNEVREIRQQRRRGRIPTRMARWLKQRRAHARMGSPPPRAGSVFDRGSGALPVPSAVGTGMRDGKLRQSTSAKILNEERHGDPLGARRSYAPGTSPRAMRVQRKGMKNFLVPFRSWSDRCGRISTARTESTGGARQRTESSFFCKITFRALNSRRFQKITPPPSAQISPPVSFLVAPRPGHTWPFQVFRVFLSSRAYPVASLHAQN